MSEKSENKKNVCFCKDKSNEPVVNHNLIGCLGNTASIMKCNFLDWIELFLSKINPNIT